VRSARSWAVLGSAGGAGESRDLEDEGAGDGDGDGCAGVSVVLAAFSASSAAVRSSRVVT
jgi:hypothetical protein